MRRRLLFLFLAVGLLGAPATADAYQNGRASFSELGQVPITGNTAYLSKQGAASFNTMRRCALADGVDLYPTYSTWHPAATAYRTVAQQQALWLRYLNHTGALAARPGTSNHGWARAVDLAAPKMRTWIDNHGRSFGWRKTEAFSEWWHVNYTGGFKRPNPGLSITSPTLAKGSGGKCMSGYVKELQRRLKLKQDGEFGSGTRAAVISYQKKHHIKPVGTVGTYTWRSIRGVQRHTTKKPPAKASVLKRGMRGADIAAAQSLINARFTEWGNKKITVDGDFGPATEKAVKTFQKVRGIKVTGQIDAKTLASLRTPSAKALAAKPSPEFIRTSPNQAARHPGTKVQAIVVHDTEGPDRPGLADLLGLGSWFSAPGHNSSQVGNDAEGHDARFVNDDRRAYAASLFNTYTVNIEQIGYARFTRAQWLKRPAQLDNTAAWIAFYSTTYRIPIRRCVVAGTSANPKTQDYRAVKVTTSGVCSHAQLGRAGGGHTDPGAGYPWDYVLRRATAMAGGAESTAKPATPGGQEPTQGAVAGKPGPVPAPTP